MEPPSGADEKSRPLTPEEEALKRNTDCVYFLASPLTCKKGKECEYRHSEGARVNPRDCWYWVNGNCLNPKCSFRHPPLDVLFGIPEITSVAALPSQTISTPQIPGVHAPTSNNPNKQNVTCYYFQKGQCLKGDRCPFMHGPHATGPQPTGTPVQQQAAKVSAYIAEPLRTVKKQSRDLKECTTQHNIPKVSTVKPVEPLPWAAKPVKRTENALNNGLAIKRSSSPYPLEFELRRPHPVSVPVSSGVSARMPRSNQSQSADESLHNGRNADELLGELSPGFDVLVDHDMVNSGYLHNQDDLGRESVRGRNMYPATDLNHHHSDFEPHINLERDQINGKDEYNIHSHFGREQKRSSSEKAGDGRLMPERRVRRREQSPDEMDVSDLRHRLIKQRRVSSSRSAVSPDRRGKPYLRDDRYAMGERYHGRHSHSQRHVPPESSISTRLQGRLKLPVRSSPDKPVDLRSERERNSGRHRGRLSPTPANHLERNHDRMKQMSHEDLATDARNLGSQHIRREDLNPLNFAGPKSLAELKGTKVSDSSNESTKSTDTRLSPDRKSMKFGKAVDFQESEFSYSFGSPKPLNDIQKRKIENAPEIGVISSNENDNSCSAEEEGEVGSFASAVLDVPYIRAPEAVKEGSRTLHSTEESKVRAAEDEEEGLIPEVGEVGHSPAKDPVEIEEGTIVGTAEVRVVENSDEWNEESDYEAIEGAVIEADDENMYLDDEEEFEDEDEDDFAKKVGVMLS